MDTALTLKFPFILNRNLAKANCTENQVCTSCDTVVLGFNKNASFVIYTPSAWMESVGWAVIKIVPEKENTPRVR